MNLVLPGRAMTILREEAGRTGISIDDLVGRERKRAVAWPRQDLMRRWRDECGYTYPRIAYWLGRDHATVIFGVRQSRHRANG